MALNPSSSLCPPTDASSLPSETFETEIVSLCVIPGFSLQGGSVSSLLTIPIVKICAILRVTSLLTRHLLVEYNSFFPFKLGLVVTWESSQ